MQKWFLLLQFFFRLVYYTVCRNLPLPPLPEWTVRWHWSMCFWEYPLPRSTLIFLAHNTEAVARKQHGASSPPAPREHCLLPGSVSVYWGRLRQAERHNVCLSLSFLPHSRSLRPVSVVECSRIVFSFHYNSVQCSVCLFLPGWTPGLP